MIENAGEITSALTRRAIVERFSAAMAGTTRKSLPLEAIRKIAKPTELQAEAGNYQKAHVRLHGLDIAIECRKGQRRKPGWPPMGAHYGYIKRTTGNDGDHLDVFIGPNVESEFVVIVDQVGADGNFDEHKTLIGFNCRDAAIDAYRASYTPGWRVGRVTTMTMDQFRRWLADGCQRTPAAVQVSKFAAV